MSEGAALQEVRNVVVTVLIGLGVVAAWILVVIAVVALFTL